MRNEQQTNETRNKGSRTMTKTRKIAETIKSQTGLSLVVINLKAMQLVSMGLVANREEALTYLAN
jgi:hypothetical protein